MARHHHLASVEQHAGDRAVGPVSYGGVRADGVHRGQPPGAAAPRAPEDSATMSTTGPRAAPAHATCCVRPTPSASMPRTAWSLSVGTNDAAPWKQVPLAEFEQALSTLMRSYSPRGWVFVAPPGVVEERLTGAPDRTNAVIDEYRQPRSRCVTTSADAWCARTSCSSPWARRPSRTTGSTSTGPATASWFLPSRQPVKAAVAGRGPPSDRRSHPRAAGHDRGPGHCRTTA